MPHVRALALVVFAWVWLGITAQPVVQPPLTTPALANIHQIRSLRREEARLSHPVRLQAQVTYFDDAWGSLFVQQGTNGIYVNRANGRQLFTAGQLLDITGFVGPGDFAPVIVATDLTITGTAPLPPPRSVAVDRVVSGQEDSQRVEFQGIVRSATLAEDHLTLEVTGPAGLFQVIIPAGPGFQAPPGLVDAEVRLQGVLGTIFNSRSQLLGFRLFVQDLTGVKVETTPVADPFQLPLRPLESVLQFAPQEKSGHRVRVAGVVTLAQPGGMLVLQTNQTALRVEGADTTGFHAGELIEAAGFPTPSPSGPVLLNSLIRRKGPGEAIVPQACRAPEISSELDGLLVTLPGRLLDRHQRGARHTLVLRDAGRSFEAVWIAETEAALPAWIATDSVLQLTGVCLVEANPASQPAGLQLHLRGPADITVIAAAPWLDARRARQAALALLVVMLSAVMWIRLLRRRVAEQTGLIQARLQNEQALEHRYRELTENATDLIYTVDLEGHLTSVNPAIERLTGYTRPEALGLTLAQLTPPEDTNAVRGMLHSERSNGPTEVSFVTKDGTRRPVEINSRRFQRADGIFEIEGVARDISERKRFEHALAAIVKGTAGSVGQDFFLRVVQELAAALQVRYAFIGELTPGVASRVRTLAVCSAGGIIPNFDYDLAGTPCAAVAGQNPGFHPANARQSFPEDHRLAAWAIESYLGAPLLAADGKTLGLIGVMDTRRMEPNNQFTSILSIFAARAGVELERLRYEKSLRESEERFRALSEHSPAGVYLQDAAGNCLYTNARWQAIAGITLEQSLGAGWLKVIHPDDLARAAREWAEAVAGGRNFRTELRFVRPSGEPRWVNISAGRLEAGDGLASGYVGTIEDITERKAADDALRESEQRHRLLVENSHDLVAELSADGFFVYLSPNYEALLGYVVDDLTGRQAIDLVHPEDRPGFSERFAQPAAWSSYRCRHRNGEWRWLESSIRWFQVPRGESRCVIISRDTTERVHAEQARKQLEARLQQTQKMEAIGTLAGGIAHDFNNILTGIFGNVELARLDLAASHPAQINLDNILSAAKRARDVVSQILTFSRRREQRATVIQMGPVIEEACKLLRASLPPSVVIAIDIPGNTLPVLADPTQIHQVIINLCTNAVHALGAAGGRLEIRQAVVELEADQARAHALAEAGKYARLSISDTGQGMDEATLKHIFEPFFTTKPPGQGTGLGLAVVHGIMQNHRGGIAVESKPGQGSTFHLFFPVVEQAAVAATQPANPLPAGVGQRILLVDDEPEVARLSERILQRHGYLVTAFTEPKRALVAFSADPLQFDLLLTDFTMPGMTGLQLATAARLLHPGLPVILCTGYRSNVDAEETSRAGVKELLGKPFDLRLLLETVHRVLGSATDPG